MLPIKFAPGVQADLLALDAQLRAISFAWMARLRREPQLGKPLQYRYGQDLQGARKLYVGREDRPSNPLSKPTLTAGGPPVRIAYEVQPDERHPERILILAIGAKPDIYDDAAARR